MTASLLTELEAAGITLTRNGDRLHYQTQPGVSLEPFRDQIVANKPALIRELLQREIVTAASVDLAHFDRAAFDRLWEQLRALPDSEAVAAALFPQLEAGWDWLQEHPNHPSDDAFLDRWLVKLRDYELAYARSQGGNL